MTSVILIHLEESLTISPYQIQSSVSVSILREFISAIEGNPVKISAINLGGPQLLCEEFGFTEFSSKLCRFVEGSEDSKEAQLGNFVTRMRIAVLRESFGFIVNGSVIKGEIAETASRFSRIREQLSVDGSVRKLFLFTTVELNQQTFAALHSFFQVKLLQKKDC